MTHTHLTKRDGRSDLDIVEVIVVVAAEAAVAAVDIIRLRKDMAILFLSLQETAITDPKVMIIRSFRAMMISIDADK